MAGLPTGRVAHAGMLALLAAAALAGCAQDGGGDGASPPAQDAATATSPDAFDMDGVACRELLFIASVPVAQARRFVPAPYGLLGEDTGSATAFAGQKLCDTLSIDGASVGATSTSDVGVFIDKGEPGVFHYYQAWWTTDNPQLLARLSAQGWTAGPSTDRQTALGPAAGAAGATVEWAGGNYSFVALLAASPADGDNRAVGWFDTPNGTVTVDKLLQGSRLGTGQGSLLGEGMAQDLFGSRADGLALWNEYAMDGRVGPAT